jgi:hypothetical protein
LRAVLRACFGAIAALAVATCSLVERPTSSPDLPIYVPDLVGVIRSQELVGQELRFTLTDGRTLAIPAGLQNLGNLLTANDRLLVTGHAPTAWAFGVVLVPPSALIPDGCYQLHGRIREDASNVFVTFDDARGDVFVRFPKATDWHDLGYIEGTDIVQGLDTCINKDGLAVEHH